MSWELRRTLIPPQRKRRRQLIWSLSSHAPLSDLSDPEGPPWLQLWCDLDKPLKSSALPDSHRRSEDHLCSSTVAFRPHEHLPKRPASHALRGARRSGSLPPTSHEFSSRASRSTSCSEELSIDPSTRFRSLMRTLPTKHRLLHHPKTARLSRSRRLSPPKRIGDSNSTQELRRPLLFC